MSRRVNGEQVPTTSSGGEILVTERTDEDRERSGSVDPVRRRPCVGRTGPSSDTPVRVGDRYNRIGKQTSPGE